MVIDDKLLSKLEKLSYLEIEPEKREEIKSELSEILNFVENLNELDISNLPSKFTIREVYAHLREDVTNVDKKIGEFIVQHSPQSEDNFFVVPKIIE